MRDDICQRYADLVTAWFEPGMRLARLSELLAVRDEEMERLRAEVEADDKAIGELNTSVTRMEKRAAGWRERAEKAEAANALLRERLDALIAAGFGATTDTLRDLRATLDHSMEAK